MNYIQTLRDFNAWWRGDDRIKQPDHIKIGESIDKLISNAILLQQMEKAVDRAIERRRQAQATESRYPRMTYEDGVVDALEWVIGDNEFDPTEDHEP